MAEPTTVHLDGRQLRVLAHPLRMRLLAHLRLEGPGTSSSLASALDTNSGQTSYHLRQLAEVGLVEDDPDRGTGRDRWWRAAHEQTSWTFEELADDPDNVVAMEWMHGEAARFRNERFNDWLRRWPDEDRTWLAASDSSDFLAHLTADELVALRDEVHDVIRRHRDAAADGDGDGRRRVSVIVNAFPHDP